MVRQETNMPIFDPHPFTTLGVAKIYFNKFVDYEVPCDF